MTGMYKGADPTAPGGMPLPALKVELVEKHGHKMADLRDIKWGKIIDMVIAERINRETEMLAAEQAAPEYPCDEDADLMGEDLFGEFEDEEPDLSDYAEDFIAQDHEAAVLDLAPITSAIYSGDDADNMDALMADLSSERDEHLATLPPPLFLGLPGIRDYRFDGHAGAGPSGAERWMNCTMSLSAARAFLETLTPNQQREFASGSAAARQGTTAHAVGEVRVREVIGEVDSAEVESVLLDLTLEPDSAEEAYDEEMGEHLDAYVDLVKTYHDAGHQILVEARVEAAIPLDQPGLVEDDFYVITGSADMIAMPIESEPVLTVGDLKYGDGIDVSVEANPQVRIYALGALALCVDDEGNLPEWLTDVEYVICQPRLGGIKVWTETVEELLDWRDTVLTPALTAALGGEKYGATYAPSDETCQWCPARGGCAALAEQRIEAGADLFDAVLDEEVLTPEALSDERLGDLLTQVLSLDGIKDALKAEAQRRLHRGAEVPGFRLVSYTPPRTWKEGAEEKIKQALDAKTAAKMYKPQTLITAKQALTLLGDGAPAIESLIEVPDKRPVISTGAKDKRKSWVGQPPEAMFADESGA